MTGLRRSFWVLRLVLAALSGWTLRTFRRLARRRPRIWHGHWPVVMTPDMVRADRLAGYPSRAVATDTKLLSYTLIRDEEFDRILMAAGVGADTLHWRAMIDLHLHADIWVSHFDCHPFPIEERRRNRLALRIARLAGIRIVVLPHGTDILRKDRPPTRYDWIGRIERDYASWDLSRQTEISRERIGLFTRFSDFVIAPDPATARLVEKVDLLFKYPTVTGLRPATGRRAGPMRVVHAPNHREVKGTSYLIEACDALRRGGADLELVLVERVSRREALEIYADADVIADQFCIGASGVFGIEGLALGKPVMAYLDAEHLRNSSLNLPFIQSTPENLIEVLACLAAVPQLRTRIGAISREAFEKYQSSAAIAEVWDRIYRHLWWGAPLDLEKTAHFSPDRGPRSLTEDPAVEDFWPVPVRDLLPAIGAAIERIR